MGNGGSGCGGSISDAFTAPSVCSSGVFSAAAACPGADAGADFCSDAASGVGGAGAGAGVGAGARFGWAGTDAGAGASVVTIAAAEAGTAICSETEGVVPVPGAISDDAGSTEIIALGSGFAALVWCFGCFGFFLFSLFSFGGLSLELLVMQRTLHWLH